MAAGGSGEGKTLQQSSKKKHGQKSSKKSSKKARAPHRSCRQRQPQPHPSWAAAVRSFARPATPMAAAARRLWEAAVPEWVKEQERTTKHESVLHTSTSVYLKPQQARTTAR